MEGDAGPQVAVYDSFNHGNPPFFQYQFLPGKGCEGVYGAKQAALSGRLNLNFDTPCASDKEKNIYNGDGSSALWKFRNLEGFPLTTPDSENGTGAGESGKSLHSERLQRINSLDLRLDSAHTAADLQHRTDLCITEQKRKQSLFSNGSPTPQISSMNGDDSVDEDAGNLSLKLCPGSFSYLEDVGNSSRNPKRYRSSSPGSQFPSCQVDNCHADLKHAKDYHRRHKVCEMHSKASQSLVHGIMQRFCQQCSRFHPLQEFDEGKRSCRRRLAGHNKRRRKPHPDVGSTGVLLSDAVRGSELLSIFTLLSQLQSANAKEKIDVPCERQESMLQGLKKANLFLPTAGPVTRDATPTASGLNTMRQTTCQTLPRVQRSDQESQTGLLAALASLSPEALSLVLQSRLGAQISPAQGKVQRQTQHVPCNDQSIHPLLSSGLKSSEELRNASDRIVERSNIHCTLPFAFPEKSVRPNAGADRSEKPSRPSVTRQYLGPHYVEGDHDRVPASDHSSPPPEQNFFLSQSGNGLKDGTASRMNGTACRSELMERCLSVEDLDNHGSRHGISRTPVSDRPGWQPSDSSESGSDHSPASSCSDWQELSGRIIFKLFDEKNHKKNLGDFSQEIQEWLASTPSSVEGYTRHGCILLTIFLAMPPHHWKELLANLQGSLERLIRCSHCDSWTKGRILVQVKQQRALIVNGQIRKMRCLRSTKGPILTSVRPLAIVAGEEATLVVSGHNLVPQAKILCVYNGEHVLHQVSMRIKDIHVDPDSGSFERGECEKQVQQLHFPGGPANVFGRCFIEVEHNLLGNILPVIVADNAICSELCSLEQELDSASPIKLRRGNELSLDELYVDKKAEAINFLHELGWVFQRSCWAGSPSCLEMSPTLPFKLSRFKALLKYAVLHDWCAVVKKLLDLLISIGVKENSGSCQEVLRVLSEVNLVHQAVKRRCGMMVELLLQYVPPGNELRGQSIFTPVMEGPAGLTPLHVAASISNAMDIVDALTSDPYQAGLHAWKNACDCSGRTPEWHALNSGNLSYVQLVNGKLARKQSQCVTIRIGDMPQQAEHSNIEGKDFSAIRTWDTANLSRMLVELQSIFLKPKTPAASVCGDCKKSMARNCVVAPGRNARMHRPLMMMMVAVATVCAAVALLLKSLPHLESVYYSLKWEGIEFGSL